MRILETCTILAEKEYEKLRDQADFNKHVDPLKYVWRLFLSVFTFLCGVSVLLIYILKFMDMFGPESQEKSQNPIESLGQYINEEVDQDGGATLLMAEIFCTLLFVALNLYIIWITHHGNYTIGQRHAFFTFYRLREGETLLGQFIANVSFNNVVSMGALHYTTLIFWTWTKGSIIFRIVNYNKYSVMNVRI